MGRKSQRKGRCADCGNTTEKDGSLIYCPECGFEYELKNHGKPKRISKEEMAEFLNGHKK